MLRRQTELSWLTRRLSILIAFLAYLTISVVGRSSLAATKLNPGDILVTDLSTASVICVDPGSGAQTLLSSGGLLVSPVGMALDANGDVLVSLADPGNGRIIRLDPDTGGQSLVSSGGFLNNPHGMVIDEEGMLIVADRGNGRIIRVDPVTGMQTIISSGGEFGAPSDVAIDEYGDLLVVTSQKVIRVDPDTGIQNLVSSYGYFVGLRGITVADSGQILVADFGSGRIIQVDPETGVQTIFSPFSGNVFDVAIDADRHIIGSDPNYRIFRVDPATGARITISQGDLLGGALRGITIVPAVLVVEIDVKPGSDPNCFNLNGHGVIPVAINGTASFDVSDIDVDSILFDGLEVRVRGKKGPLCSIEDWNNDGYEDMVCHFEDDPDSWTGGDATATLSGELVDGTPFEGADSICIVQEY